MATGFAASLFGLGGSLVVGMLARFTHQAAGVLKREFEAWLAAVAQIDKLHADAPATIVRDTLQPRVTELLARIVADYGKSVRGLEQSTELLSRLTESGAQSIRAIDSLNGEIARLAAEQTALRAELQTLSGVTPAIEKLTGAVETTTRTTAERAEAAAAELAQSLSRIERTQSEALISVVARQSETSVHTLAAVDRGLGRLDTMLDGLQAAQNATQRTLATLQHDTTQGLAAIADRHVAAIATLAGSVERSQSQTQQVLGDLRLDATLSLTQIADRHAATVGTLVGTVERTQAETQRLVATHQQSLATVVSAATETLAKAAAPAIDAPGQSQALEAATRELSASVAEFCTAANMGRHPNPAEATIATEALARIGKAVEMLSDRQLDDNATTQMLAAVDRSMSRGFGEIARAIEAALSTYADVIALTAAEAPGSAEAAPVVEPAADAEPDVTTTAFLRSLTANAGRAGSRRRTSSHERSGRHQIPQLSHAGLRSGQEERSQPPPVCASPLPARRQDARPGAPFRHRRHRHRDLAQGRPLPARQHVHPQPRRPDRIRDHRQHGSARPHPERDAHGVRHHADVGADRRAAQSACCHRRRARYAGPRPARSGRR